MKRVLTVLAIGALALGFASPALADRPGSEGKGNKPDCHGANEAPCRPDPQPDHGRDCTRSDDHVCLTTTTTAPTSTTTTVPTLIPPPATPTTRTEVPSTTTTTAAPSTPTSPPGTPSVESPSVPAPPASDTGRLTELPATGAGTAALAGLGIWFMLCGALIMWLARRTAREDV